MTHTVSKEALNVGISIKLVVKADIPHCSGAGCRVCEEYLPGFFSKNGGIMVAEKPDERDGAYVAVEFCPQRCISVEEYNGNE